MRVIKLDDNLEVVRYLERAHYEVKGHENIINYMSLNKMVHLDHYKTLWEEYIDCLKVYDDAKLKFTRECVIPLAGEKFSGEWEITFSTNEVILYD